MDGVPVDLTFRFYDADTAGNLLVTLQQMAVQVTGGVFNVLIGSGTLTKGAEPTLTEVFQNHRRVWMSIEVGTDGEMGPRLRIASVAYAFSAEKAATAEDLTHIDPRPVAPANPRIGDVFLDSSVGNVLKVWDGAFWKACW